MPRHHVLLREGRAMSLATFAAASQPPAAYPNDRLGRRDFDRLARYIFDYSGIKMPPTKMTMLEGRLRRRVKACGLATFEDYCAFLFDQGGLEHEALYLIDAVTTNKTDFYREPNHFRHMLDHALPHYANAGVNRLRIWSSACSTGAEPYTIAMVMEEFGKTGKRMDYTILATDLSNEVLETARKGIYPREQLAPVPVDQRARFVMQHRDKTCAEVRIHPKLRSRVSFARLNLMDARYPVGDRMHVIFCRNVLIYFDKPTQEKVLSRLCECLLPGGFLYIGHSESVAGMNLPITQAANTVFRKL